MALSQGARLGPYEILTLVGTGGMGEVYKGRDTRLDRTVAIKVLPQALVSEELIMKRSTLVIAMLVLSFGQSMTNTQASKPGPEHQKLEDWVGTWTYAIDVKASPFGPAGKSTGRDRVELGPGGFTLVFNTDMIGPAGSIKSLAIMGYDASAKRYTWYVVDSNGGVTTAKGSVTGNTWTVTTESIVAGKTVKGRNRTTFGSPTMYTWTFEIADEKGGYTLIEEGKATKAR